MEKKTKRLIVFIGNEPQVWEVGQDGIKEIRVNNLNHTIELAKEGVDAKGVKFLDRATFHNTPYIESELTEYVNPIITA